MTSTKTWIEISDTLDKHDPIVDILVMAFHDGELLLLKSALGHRFPRARFEDREAMNKTVRREVYEQTGAFLKESRLLGLLKAEDTRGESSQTPIYVGLVHNVESPVLKDVGRRVFHDPDDAFKLLDPEEWKRTRGVLFYHAFRLHQDMERDLRRGERW